MNTRPQLRRQIDTAPLWVFWRDHPNGPGRQGFLCTAIACINPACNCTEVTLSGILVDDRLLTARMEARSFKMEWHGGRGNVDAAIRSGEAARAVVLDLESHALRTASENDADVLAWLTAEVDDELVDAARQLTEGTRHERLAAPDPWRDWRPGDLVSYSDAFPHSVLADFALHGQRWILDDLHCVEQTCACRDVRVICDRLPEHGPSQAEFAGTFVVTLPDLEPHDFECEDDDSVTPESLRELWGELRRRRPSLADNLATRRQKMKDLRPPSLSAPAQRATKIGRNDPCPCGSGRKWKKCCGRPGAASAATT
jgi:hypothetical protein